ncbi:hypothetical protein [Achromobacter xylosoxidans]|uniref:hypothetical protein n=1 Tax=Alcaligenes xylosoxydans xylosoxydans TaxID=85698 RepID=UPI0038FD34E6
MEQIHQAGPIGASFADELKEKGGLIGQHFTWTPEGMVEFFDDTPQEVVDGVLEVLDAHEGTQT